MVRRKILLLLIVVVQGCGRDSGVDEPNRVTSRQSLRAATTPTAQVGEDCEANGRTACRPQPGAKTGFCVTARTAAGRGHVCTVPCRASSQCPASWICAELTPSPDSSFCIPPRGWVPAPTYVPTGVPDPRYPGPADAGAFTRAMLAGGQDGGAR